MSQSTDQSSEKAVKPNWRDPIHWLAFGFGSGAIRKAPGTWGTLAAIPFYLLMADLAWPLYLGIVLAALFAGIYICEKTANDLGVHDHGGIVWDEFVGLWITLFLLPSGWLWLLAGFILFRLFDILKPWPISWADKKLGGGFGIMVDDVIAGVFALIILQIAAFLL